MARTAVRLRITGLVHGVFFRASMAELATNHGVSGWVRNMTDGSIQAFLEGDDEKVMHIVEWAKRGPPRARVDSVKMEKVRVKNSRSFRIEG